MAISEEEARKRRVHLLENVGVHLVVQCPDCKGDLILMAQIASSQCAQDKDGYRSLSDDDHDIILGGTKEPNSPDTFDLQSRLSDTEYVLAVKREKRKKREDVDHFEGFSSPEFDFPPPPKKAMAFQMDDTPTTTPTKKPAPTPVKTPDDSVTIDPSSTPLEKKKEATFSLKAPPKRGTLSVVNDAPPRRQRMDLTLNMIRTIEANNDMQNSDCSSLSSRK